MKLNASDELASNTVIEVTSIDKTQTISIDQKFLDKTINETAALDAKQKVVIDGIQNNGESFSKNLNSVSITTAQLELRITGDTTINAVNSDDFFNGDSDKPKIVMTNNAVLSLNSALLDRVTNSVVVESEIKKVDVGAKNIYSSLDVTLGQGLLDATSLTVGENMEFTLTSVIPVDNANKPDVRAPHVDIVNYTTITAVHETLNKNDKKITFVKNHNLSTGDIVSIRHTNGTNQFMVRSAPSTKEIVVDESLSGIAISTATGRSDNDVVNDKITIERHLKYY